MQSAELLTEGPGVSEAVRAQLTDITHRYLSLVSKEWKTGVGAAVFLVLVSLPWLRRRVVLRGRAATVVMLAVVVAGGLYLSWSLCWASDDAYISFRYSRNLARGSGLVFNPGERVEGYTDFLWTLLMALPVRFHVHPGQAGIVLSLLSFVSLILLLSRLAERLAPRSGVLVGMGPLLLAANYTVTSFATSALETVFATTLAVSSLERAEARRPFVAGLLGVLATMTHPDHAIFYAALGVALLSFRESRKHFGRYALPFILIFVPYYFWRWWYYGDFMPNTYYAKSADKAYVSQGLLYFWMTFLSAGLWALLPLSTLGMFSSRQRVSGRFGMIALPIYIAYVIKIGGDFMFGRLYTTALAFTFLFADVGFRSALNSGRNSLAAALASLGSFAAIPVRLVHPGELFYGVADERTFTPVRDFATMEIGAAGYELGRILKRELRDRGVRPRVGLFSLGMASYESDLPVFDMRGLTSRSVAHLPIKQRGRPGHEKTATPGHLLEAGVDMAEMSLYPPPYEDLTVARFGGFRMYQVRYNPAFTIALHRGSSFPVFPRHLDSAIPALGSAGPERMACDLWHMKEYYFKVNDDSPRRHSAEASAVRADPSLKGVAALLLETREPAALGFTRLRVFSFEGNLSGWQGAEDASLFTRSSVQPEQGLVFGAEGEFLNTFAAKTGDQLIGTLTSPEFTLEGDVLAFRIGGGMDPAHLRLDLLVDGTRVRTATGCVSEWLDRRFWDIRPFRGMKARLVVEDTASGPWGHLVVDEIEEWRAPVVH